MFDYIWPIVLVLFSNTIYQICAKGVPDNASPFAVLSITYLVAAIFSTIMHFVTHPSSNILKEFTKMNWAPYVLGLVIVGLEVGWIYAYKAGWQVSTGFIVQSAILSVILIFVGYLLYQEALIWNKLVGIGICLVGLFFINMK